MYYYWCLQKNTSNLDNNYPDFKITSFRADTIFFLTNKDNCLQLQIILRLTTQIDTISTSLKISGKSISNAFLYNTGGTLISASSNSPVYFFASGF